MPRGARPLPARLKTSLFGVLAPVLDGARVLDLCAGVGGFGLEALSRGADEVTLVERDPRAAAALEAWLREVGVADVAAARVEPGEPRARVVRANWRRAARGGPFDLVFLDPPYDDWERDPALDEGLAAIARVLAPDGVLVVKRPTRAGPWRREGFAVTRRVEVGSTAYEVLRPAPPSPLDADPPPDQGEPANGRS